MKALGGARWPLWGVLVAVAVWGGIATWRRANRDTQILATTVCPFRGPPRIVISADAAPDDTAFVRVHENVHAAQCRDLGPIRYRWKNVFASGKLELEAPAYCAAAVARIRAGLDSARVASRLRDDAVEALSNVADSVAVIGALRAHCPQIIAAPPAS